MRSKWNHFKIFSDTLFCTDVAFEHHLIVKCDIQMSFWYIQDILQFSVGRCLQNMLYCKIQKLLHAMRIVGYKRMIVMQISICHASWFFPQQNHERCSKNWAFAKNCNLESWTKKYSKCNFEFINNKIMLNTCKML